MFNWIKEKTLQIRNALTLPAFSGWGNNWLLQGHNTASKIYITPDNALQCSAVKCAVYKISSTISGLPLITYKSRSDGGRDRATKHPLYRLLKCRPNPTTSKETFWQAMIQNLLLHGIGCAEIVRDGAGQSRELYVIHPWRVSVQRATGEIYIDGASFPLTELFVITYMSNDTLQPLSPVELGREAIALAVRLEKFKGAWFGNAARPSVAIKHPQQVSEQAEKNMKQSFRDLYGEHNVGDVAVLQEGTDLIQLGSNNEESQLKELSDWTTEEIGRVFNINPILLGSMGRATWGNLVELNQDVIQSTYAPIVNKIESEISLKLLSEDEQETYFAEFLYDELLKGKPLERQQVYDLAIANDVLTPDEARILENRNPLDEQDEEDDVTLDGGQIQSLMAVADKLATGAYPQEAAQAMLQACFPDMQLSLIETMVKSLVANPIEPTPIPTIPQPSGIDTSNGNSTDQSGNQGNTDNAGDTGSAQ